MTRALLAAMIAAALFLTNAAGAAKAEDGYDLWLRYPAVEAGAAADYRVAATQLVVAGESASLGVATDELERGLSGLLSATPDRADAVSRDGAVLVGRAEDAAIAALGLDLSGLGAEGYVIRSLEVDGHAATVIAGGGDAGTLYGTFHFLRLIQTRQTLTALNIREAPAVDLRLLNHWDNLDRTVERGYAGQSLWDWHKLPDHLDPRYTDYARANASIGINGTVINNVNTDALSLTGPWLEKAAALADLFRPYGIRVYLSARFSAPVEIGGLDTAGPLDPRVQAWWRAKADEIYALIPDFGGFLVKANSEGQPGPQDYGRSHADGANMLADAVAPHGGVVMWRAFVYSDAEPTDRAMQAYDEFVPLDGQFRDNVIIQVKNGPIDFQPREPFHPLFGATPETPLMMEFQITKEYLGFATHLAYLGPLYEEVLDADTHVRGPGSTVAHVVDGSLFGHRLTGMAGVANTGSDRNWSGSQFDQANWYVFGRLAWDPGLGAEAIAREWAAMTFTPDPAFVEPVVEMMMGSREAVVDYMTPLGLNHLMATGHHYGPGPWVDDLPRADWNPTYFHRADADGIGFDRTASGSDAVSQYAPEVAAGFADPERIDERLLLWFHHLPWDHPMPSGWPLWDELVARYDRGVAATGEMRRTWAGLADHVDARRHSEVADFLAIQEDEARWWRDSSIAWWRSLNGLPMPEGHAPPAHDLAHYERLSFPHAPGHWD